MKYLFKSAWLLAAGATLLAACSTDDTTNPAPTPGKVQVSFGATLPQKGRSTIEIDEENGRFSGAWESSDAITLYANGTPERFDYDPNQKVFTGELLDQTTNWTYRAVYPYVESEPLKIPFGSARTQQGNAFNGDYDPLLSDKVEVSNAGPGVDADGQPVIFGLERLTAIVALTFNTDAADVADEKVTSVTLTAAEGTLANDFFTIDPASSTGTLTGDNASSAITISYAAESAPTAASFKAFFNVPAGTYGNLTATIRTEGHTATVNLTAGATLTAGELIYNPNKAITNWQAAETGGPTMEWVENPDFTDTPIEDGMQVHVNLKAPAGIKVFGITINSAILAPIVTDPSMDFGFTADGENTATIDLVQNPNETLMGVLGLTGTDLTSATEIPLDLSQLIPLIKMIGAPEESKHIFTLNLVDKNDTPLEKSLTFYIPKAAAEPTATFSDIDLWANTAKITLTDAPDGATVQYKRADAQEWNTLTAESDGSFLIKTPSWTKSQNDAGLDIYTVNANEGIFANTTYKWQILNAEQAVIASGEYKTDAGDAIPNAGMDNWTTFNVTGSTFTKGEVVCANASADNMFWASGNNKNVSHLCTEATDISGANGSCAKLKGEEATGKIFAPGNLFSGTMQFGTGLFDMFGYADFGQQFTYTARPSAIKVRIKGSVNTVQKVGSDDPQKSSITIGETIDPIRLFVCITDWKGRHCVQSGKSLDSSTFWDPTTKVNPGEGNIIAYAERTFTESINDWTDIVIPLCFYDKEAAIPAADKYSFVFSAAASARGDYLTGCYENELYIDNIEWVY